MKKTCYAIHLPLSLILCLAAETAGAQNPAASAAVDQQRVESSSTKILPDGRRLTIERVTPPAIVTPPPAPGAAASRQINEQELAARRAAWLATAPLETRLLPLTATIYPGGVSHLSWRYQKSSGDFAEMEAWSRTDFSSLHIVPDLNVDRVRYLVFPVVLRGEQRSVPRRVVPDLSGLQAGEILLTRGESGDFAAIAPVLKLHDYYLEHGPQLSAAWQDMERAARDEKERKRTAPPEDIVVRYWESNPLRSKGGAK